MINTNGNNEQDLARIFNKTRAIRDTVREIRQKMQRLSAMGNDKAALDAALEDDPLCEIEKRVSLCLYVIDRHLGEASPARGAPAEINLPDGLTRPNAEKVYRHLTDLSVKTTVLQGVLNELEDLSSLPLKKAVTQTSKTLFDLYPQKLKAS